MQLAFQTRQFSKSRGTRLTRHVEMSSKLSIFCRKAGIPSSGTTRKDTAGAETVRKKTAEAAEGVPTLSD